MKHDGLSSTKILYGTLVEQWIAQEKPEVLK